MILLKLLSRHRGTILLFWALRLWCLDSSHQVKITMYLKKPKSIMPYHQSKILILNHGSMKWVLKLYHIRLLFSLFRWTAGPTITCWLLMILTAQQEWLLDKLRFKRWKLLQKISQPHFTQQVNCQHFLTNTEVQDKYAIMLTGHILKVSILMMLSILQLELILTQLGLHATQLEKISPKHSMILIIH